jgi:hypothetical protein
MEFGCEDLREMYLVKCHVQLRTSKLLILSFWVTLPMKSKFITKLRRKYTNVVG